MFVQDADGACLRQGDVVEGVPLPLITPSKTTLLGFPNPETHGSELPTLEAITHVHRNDPNWVTVQFPARMSYCVVVSQCCDLEPRNGRILIPTFVVARLKEVPRGIRENPQALAKLKANKDPRNTADPGYINLFHIPAVERLEKKEWVVDFNQLFAIPSSEFPWILRKKILQMETEWRVKFKIKLAASLTRLTDEEIRAGWEDPWKGKQEPLKFSE